MIRAKALGAIMFSLLALVGCVATEAPGKQGPTDEPPALSESEPTPQRTGEPIMITDTHGQPTALDGHSTMICIETHSFLVQTWSEYTGKVTITRRAATRFPEQDYRCQKLAGEPEPGDLRVTDTFGEPVSLPGELTVLCLDDSAFLSIDRVALTRYPEQDFRCA